MTIQKQNTAEAIGALTAQITAMNDRLDRDREDLKQRDAEAANSREDVRASLAELKSGHTALLARMDKVEPVTDMVTGFKAKFIGAMFVMGMIGSAVLGFVAYFKQQVTQAIFGG